MADMHDVSNCQLAPGIVVHVCSYKAGLDEGSTVQKERWQVGQPTVRKG